MSKQKAKRSEVGDPISPAILSQLETWIDSGIPCDYVQFSTKPIPISKGKEPVWEMKTETQDLKYKVNSIFYTPHGVIIGADGRIKVIALGNIAHAQFT